jgi:hypothetical protein
MDPDSHHFSSPNMLDPRVPGASSTKKCQNGARTQSYRWMLLPASLVQLNDSVTSTVPDVQIQTVAGPKSANELELAVNESGYKSTNLRWQVTNQRMILR